MRRGSDVVILGIETATEACSVAVGREGAVWNEHQVVPRAHHRLLLPMIDALLVRAGVRRDELTLVAFGCGPGSFTGVRIAASAAQGIALALDIPVAPISTHEVLACSAVRLARPDGGVVTAVTSRRNELLLATWANEDDGCVSMRDVCAVALQDAAEWLAPYAGFAVAGDGVDALAAEVAAGRIPTLLDSGVRYPDARDIIPLARRAWHAGTVVGAEAALPRYLEGDTPWRKLAR
jgi:tRNA threonylcarbamoyladenosine biosynthesis protein TsaB